MRGGARRIPYLMMSTNRSRDLGQDTCDPANTLRRNNVVTTSLQRRDVAATL